MNNMKSEVCLMPEQCSNCGALFDLSYDLEGVSMDRLMAVVLRAKLNGKALLCWECRNIK